MPKPYLIIVSGRPGAGKTTFAKAFAQAACLPVISRDQLKEGYVHTQGRPSEELPEGVNGLATDLFFQVLEKLIEGGVSVVAEAAFQHRVWSSRLEPLKDRVRLRVIICRAGEDGRIALDRFLQRGLKDPRRGYFHGDKGVEMARQGIEVEVSAYEEPRLDAPTYHVDTSEGYRPGIEELARNIFAVQGR